MKFKILGLLIFGSALAIAGTSSRTIPADFIKTIGGVRALWTIPNGANDTFVGKATTDTLTNKTMDGATNTWTNIPANTAFTGITPVNRGGQGLATLTAGGLLVGEGTSPVNLVSGAQFQPLVANVSGDPSFQALALNQSAAVTGTLPIANGGTNNPSLSVTNGNLVYTDGTKQATIAVGTAGQILMGGTIPAWSNNTMTKQIFTATGSTVGQWFTITALAANTAVGCTYTNNAQTFVVQASALTGATRIWMTQTGAPLASGTLTYSSGGGVACNGGTGTNITFSAAVPIAAYTAPANVRLLKVVTVGGGGSGGGAATLAASAGAGGGGSGGGTCVKYITSPQGTYYYSIGAGGIAATSAAVGQPGVISSFAGGANTLVAANGLGGAIGTASVLIQIVGGNISNGSTGCDINIPGWAGNRGIVLSAAQACAGEGGGTSVSGGTSSICNANSAGQVGLANTGQGSSGGVEISAGAAQTSTAGGSGLVYVEEYY